jgi:hypothetical protein
MTPADFQPALTHCYFCGQPDKILLPTKAGVSVQDCHGKIIDREPCARCADFMKAGIIVFSIDEAHSEPGEEPYRTGDLVVVTPDGFDRVIATLRPHVVPQALGTLDAQQAFAHKHRFTFLPEALMRTLGLLEPESR